MEVSTYIFSLLQEKKNSMSDTDTKKVTVQVK